MKQSSNNKNRSNGRYGHFNNNRRSNFINRNTVFDSTGPCGRIRGTAQQLIDKYLSAAKDAKGQNDRILWEVCQQHAEHYARLLAMAIQNERPAPVLEENTPAPQETALTEQTPVSEEPTPKEVQPETPVISEAVEKQSSQVEQNRLPKLSFMEVALPDTPDAPLEDEKEQKAPLKTTRKPRKPKKEQTPAA